MSWNFIYLNLFSETVLVEERVRLIVAEFEIEIGG